MTLGKAGQGKHNIWFHLGSAVIMAWLALATSVYLYNLITWHGRLERINQFIELVLR